MTFYTYCIVSCEAAVEAELWNATLKSEVLHATVFHSHYPDYYDKITVMLCQKAEEKKV